MAGWARDYKCVSVTSTYVKGSHVFSLFPFPPALARRSRRIDPHTTLSMYGVGRLNVVSIYVSLRGNGIVDSFFTDKWVLFLLAVSSDKRERERWRWFLQFALIEAPVLRDDESNGPTTDPLMSYYCVCQLQVYHSCTINSPPPISTCISLGLALIIFLRSRAFLVLS